MNIKSFKTIALAAVTMAAMCAPVTANAQLGGLINKAKRKPKKRSSKLLTRRRPMCRKKPRKRSKMLKMMPK